MSKITALAFLTFLLLAPAVYSVDNYNFYVDLKNYGSYNTEVKVGTTGVVFVDEMMSEVSIDASDWISVDLTVAGKPMHIDMLETHSADLDGDGKDDIQIKLHKLTDSRAELTFFKIIYLPAAEAETPSPTTSLDVATSSSGDVIVTILPPKPEPISFEILLIMVVAILAVLGYVLYMQKS